MAARAESYTDEKAWFLRTLLVLQSPRSVFAALRDDSDDAAEQRHDVAGALVWLAGIAGVLATSVTSTLAQWQALGYDGHSFISTASALFVDPSHDIYQLKTGSPAIDAGTNLSPDVVADINGLSRPQRNAYDIGCYEMP